MPASALAGNPEIDAVTLSGAGLRAGSPLTVSVSAELMKNQMQAAPVAPNRAIRVVQDNAGLPILFSIGTDGDDFALLQHDSTAANGWSVISLLKSFAGYVEITALDVVQSPSGRLALGFALSKSRGGASDLFLMQNLSDDPSRTDWSKLGEGASPAAGVPVTFRADTLALGADEDGGDVICAVSGSETVSGATVERRYEILSDLVAKPFAYPENVEPNDLKALTAGYSFGQRAFYSLYTEGDSQSLWAGSIDADGSRGPSTNYSPGHETIPAALRYTAIATPVGPGQSPLTLSSDLFVGANDGLYVFRKARIAGLQKITGDLKNVREITVRQDGDTIVVWALVAPSLLYYIRGEQGDVYRWSDPILFSDDAVHIAPIRNRIRNANEIFLVDQALNVEHHWQDPVSTLWNARTIKAPNSDFLIDVDTYTTKIHVEDAAGMALAGVKVKLSCAEWLYANVNGLTYILDPQVPAEIPLDAMGALTVIAAARDISTPVLHLESEIFGGIVNIFANGKVQKGLRGITGADSLRNARTQSGAPVFDNSQKQDVMAGVAESVGMLNQAASGLRDAMAGKVFVSVSAAGLRQDGTLNLDGLTTGSGMAFALNNGKWAPVGLATVLPAADLSIGGDLKDLAGDVLRGIVEGYKTIANGVRNGAVILKNGVSFAFHVAEEEGRKLLNFTVMIGKEIKRVALDTLGKVWTAMTWLLEKVGAGVLKILKWLGFEFLWEQIWETHKIIENMVKGGVDYAVERADRQLDAAKKAVNEKFDTVEADLNKALADLKSQPELASFRNDSVVTMAQSKKASGFTFKSPQSSFVADKISHGGLLGDAANRRIARDGADGDPLVEFLTDVVVPLFESVKDSVVTDVGALKTLITDSSKSFVDVLEVLVTLIDSVLEPARTLIVGILNFVEDLLGNIRDGLTGDADIPFLSAFYEFITNLVTGGKGEKLTFLSGLAILVAIPMTILSQIVLGRTPPELDIDVEGLKDKDLFARLSGAQPAVPAFASPSPQPVSLGAAAAGGPDEGQQSVAESFKIAYSTFGGLAATIAALLANVISIISSFAQAGGGSPPDEATSLLNKSPQEFFKAGWVNAWYAALSACIYICTIPFQRDGQATGAYVAKIVGFVLSALGSLITNISSIAFKKREVSGTVLAVVDALLLVVVLTVDITDIVFLKIKENRDKKNEMTEMDMNEVDKVETSLDLAILSILSDFFSTLGGSLQGAGDASVGKTDGIGVAVLVAAIFSILLGLGLGAGQSIAGISEGGVAQYLKLGA